MKLPRDVSGQQLAGLLRRYGYEITRQTGSHLRLTSTSRGKQHHITVPAHQQLTIGTLTSILNDVAASLEIKRHDLVQDLFGR